MKKISRPLLTGLVITLALTLWALLQPGEASQTHTPQGPAEKNTLPNSAATTTSPTVQANAQNDTRSLLPMEQDPFLVFAPEQPAENFVAPSAAVPVIAPPPEVRPPEPPPLPFKYIGSMHNGDHMIYFLSDNDRVYPTEIGKKINPDYELTEAGKNRIVLTYIPLAQTQVLPLEN